MFLKGEQIWNSIKYGLLASLGAALLAMVLAYIVQKKQVGLNKFLDFLAILPVPFPVCFWASDLCWRSTAAGCP